MNHVVLLKKFTYIFSNSLHCIFGLLHDSSLVPMARPNQEFVLCIAALLP